MSQSIRPWIFQIIWLLAIFGMLSPVHAAEFFCPSGNVTCLVAAMNEANQNRRENTIHLEAGTYSLLAIDNFLDGIPTASVGNGLPSVTGRLRIEGAGADNTIIERPTGAPNFRLMHISAEGSLEINAVSLERGGDFVSGGAILNRGLLRLRNAKLMRNVAGEAGALFNTGAATIENSLIVENFARFVTGAIHNEGHLTVSSSTIDRNGGSLNTGAIFNGGTLTMDWSTLTRNGADFSGGLVNTGSATITNSTIALNAARLGGGGIVNSGTLTVTSSSVVNNRSPTGPGIASGIQTQVSITLKNSIVAGNVDTFHQAPLNCSGPITSLGHNLFDPSGCADPLATDIIAEPGLGEFMDDGSAGGGHFPLLAGSPAIDAGDPAACSGLDQLGNPRLGICDIGSVEFQGERLLVAIDIRPNDGNNVNPESDRNINVAIFSADAFDATAIDPSTVRFGATGTEAVPVEVARRDVDGDGRREMVARFQIADLGIQCGDTSAALTGETSSGQSFFGSSPITTTGCEQRRPVLAVERNLINAGNFVTVSWSGIAAPTPTDWLGLYRLGAEDRNFIDWVYVSCTKTPARSRSRGSCEFFLPASLESGLYDLRLLAQDGFTVLANSNTFRVSPP